MTSPSGKAIDVVSEIHCKNNAKDVEKDSDYEIYEKIDINETKTYIPDEIYEKFFSLLDDDCTFEEAFKKSEINQYMTDKEDIENFKRDVEEGTKPTEPVVSPLSNAKSSVWTKAHVPSGKVW